MIPERTAVHKVTATTGNTIAATAPKHAQITMKLR